jgi:hypothetical protein
MQIVRALFGQVETRVIMVFRHNPAHSVFRGGENQSWNTGRPRNRDEAAAVYSNRCNSAG